MLFRDLDVSQGQVAVDIKAYITDVDSLCAGYEAKYPYVGVFSNTGNAESYVPEACPQGGRIEPWLREVGVEIETQNFFNGNPRIVSSTNILVNGLTSAMLRQAPAAAASPLAAAGPNVQVTLGARFMPRPDQASLDVLSFIDDINKIMGSFMVPLATSFLLPVLVFHIVHEKEHKLRATMLMMGLTMRAYWVVQYVFDLFLALVVLFAVYVLCVALGITILASHQFGVVLLLLFVWANTMVAFAFFLSTFFSRTRNANIVLYLFVFASVIASQLVNQIVFEPKPFEPAPAWWIMWPQFCLLPRCLPARHADLLL